MSQPRDISPRALQYWGVIEGAVRDRLNTADIWSLIRDQAETQGYANPGLHLADFNQLRGMAVGIRNASGALARADRPYGLDSSMIGAAPWSRPLGQQDALPMYQARFQHTVMVDGEQTTEWRTVMFRGALPATAGDLADALEQDAEQMADNYGQDHVGISNVSLLRV